MRYKLSFSFWKVSNFPKVLITALRTKVLPAIGLMTNKYKIALMTIFAGLLMAAPFNVAKAGDSASADKPTATLEMKYYKVNGARKIHVKVNDEDGNPVQNMIVNVYHRDITRASMMGSISTDEKGEGEVRLDTKRFKGRADSFVQHHFIASAGSDKRYALSQTTLDIQEVEIKLQTLATDSGKFLVAQYFKKEDGKLTPLSGEELHLYVKRSFNGLPLMKEGGEGEKPKPTVTDDSGRVIVKVPEDIPGDEKGNIVLMGRVEDSDTYGNVSTEVTVPWGLPLKADNYVERALWASRWNAPWWLVFVSCGIIGGVWLTIIFVVVQLFRVKKFGKLDVVK